VLLAGESAGGLAAMTQANMVREMLPKVQTFKVASFAGWFMGSAPQGLVSAKSPWLNAIQASYALHGYADGLSSPCVDLKRAPEDEPWRCWFPRETAPAAQVPVFVINSAFDSWQLSNVWRAGVSSCVGRDFHNCSITEAAQLAGFAHDLLQDVSSSVLTHPGSGAYITPCLAHGSRELDSAMNGLTLAQALHRWWEASKDAPTDQHTYLPCQLTVDAREDCGVKCTHGDQANKHGDQFVRDVAQGTPRVRGIENEDQQWVGCESQTTCAANLNAA